MSTARPSRTVRGPASACVASCATWAGSASRRVATQGTAAPASEAIVTGRAPFALDVYLDGLLHLKLLRSPHAHARIRSIRKDAALAVPGVRAIFTWEDVPRRLFTSACHDDYHSDPNDTYLLDDVVRFVGQRVAAVVADSVGAAEEGGRRLEVDYELLPAVFDPEEAMRPGAPVIHDKPGAECRIQHPERNIVRELHGAVGDSARRSSATVPPRVASRSSPRS
jgi:putative selenate reductase molybdopterin-binding subunit